MSSKYNDAPETGEPRPLRQRDGRVRDSARGMLVLEEHEHARPAKGANPS